MRQLSDLLGCPVLQDEPMARHTSFKVGGPADCLVLPQTEDDVMTVLAFAREREMPLTIIGAGTNLIVRDGGIRGIAMSLASEFAAYDVEGQRIHAQAGVLLATLCAAAAGCELSGLEWAMGIPGTLGGALVMNAGAFGGDTRSVVETVRVVSPDGELKQLSVEEMEFGYRTSLLKRGQQIALGATLRLCEGDPAAIQARQREILEHRRRTQPLDLPSAGSIFERPPDDYAGRLIEQAGLKGKRIGGAQVSTKHANFIVNTGGATASDILELIEHVREVVRQRFDVTLEQEVVVIGEDAR